jgi:putative oxidoreductase
MAEFREFLARNHFPYPTFCAYLSAYAQFATGILLALGLLTRWAAAVVTINFVVALVMVHRTLPFTANIAPLAMLVGAVFFVLYGAPRWSLDARLRRR